VLAEQRRLIYAERAPAACGENLSAQVRTLIDEVSGAQAADAKRRYDRREAEMGPEVARELERRVVLSVLDRVWREHLRAMPDLLNAICMRTAGEAALAEYRREATLAFNRMRQAANEEIVRALLTLSIARSDQEPSG
jgi:preprotein translocase subunit SecA